MLLRHGGLDATLKALRRRLGLAPDETREAILAAGVADSVLDAANLRLAANALLQGGKQDQPRGQAIADFLAASDGPRCPARGLCQGLHH